MVGRTDDSALSPVVGTALLIGIVLLLSVVAAYVFFGLSETNERAPQVVWEAESSDDLADWQLVHQGGDRVRGERLELRGTASPSVESAENLTTGDAVAFYPVEQEVDVVWYGEDGTSYRLRTIEVEQPLPEPDEDCDWVDAESNGGSDEVRVDGITVNCDVGTTDNVYVEDGGAVVGEVVSENKVLDVDDGTVYGDVEVERVANVQNGTVTGAMTSTGEEVKVYDTTVGGDIEAADNAEVLDGSRAEGDVLSRTADARVSRSVVEGSVRGDTRVSVSDSTVEGHVYADPADFDCTNSTVNGEDCGDYTPRDPGEW